MGRWVIINVYKESITPLHRGMQTTAFCDSLARNRNKILPPCYVSLGNDYSTCIPGAHGPVFTKIHRPGLKGSPRDSWSWKLLRRLKMPLLPIMPQRASQWSFKIPLPAHTKFQTDQISTYISSKSNNPTGWVKKESFKEKSGTYPQNYI